MGFFPRTNKGKLNAELGPCQGFSTKDVLFATAQVLSPRSLACNISPGLARYEVMRMMHVAREFEQCLQQAAFGHCHIACKRASRLGAWML